jgi:TetR/AcrR family transcriptional regulator, transcriptional repressor for nem operon
LAKNWSSLAEWAPCKKPAFWLFLKDLAGVELLRGLYLFFAMARTKNFDREVILKKAMELFWKKGFHATSIQDLVDHLGIERSSIYATYGGKDQLYEESLTHYKRINGGILDHLPPYESNIREWIRRFLYGMIEDSRKDKDRKGCFIVNAAIDWASENEFVSRFASQNQQEFLDRFAPVFLQAMEQGELDPSNDPRSLALYLFNALNGLRVLVRTTEDFEQLKTIADMSLRAFY